jgi:hypothetical protein
MIDLNKKYVRTFDFELSGYPDETFRVVLDSVTYEVRFTWNERDESWFFSLGDIGVPPTITTKLTCYSDIIGPYRYLDNVPDGNLYLFPLRNIETRVGRYNVGPLAGVQMIYASQEEDVETIF